MAIDPTKLANLLAIVRQTVPGQPSKVQVVEYLKVEWVTGTKYYGSTAAGDISPFRNVKKYTGGSKIEPRIMGEPFSLFEIHGDIRAENIPIEFNDAALTGYSGAGTIRDVLQKYGAARCELFYYYPQVDLNVSQWWGQVLPPQVYGRFTQKTTLTNGYRSRERFLPNRANLKECPGPYGGRLNTADKVRTNICPSDIHLGGTIGVAGFTDCPRLTADDCNTRLGTKKYFPGLDLSNIPPVPTGSHPGEVGVAKGNVLVRSKPITWIFGTKYIRGADILVSRRNPNTQHPEDAWIEVLYRISQGPVQSISNLKINGRVTEAQHWNTRLGQRGQSVLNFDGAGTQTASGTATLFVRHGYVDPNVTAASLEMECTVVGFADIAVWDSVSTFTRKHSDDVIWCLIEMYTNQMTGLKYEPGRFWIDEALDASEWTRRSTEFILTAPDGETKSFSGRRATFDAAVEGRPAVEVVSDVCRSARISLPFQYDGKYSIVPFAVFTEDELDDAVTFYDHGPNQNIRWNGPEAVQFSFIPDDKLPNELTVTFEEARNYDIARPIVGNDPDQQYKASKILGDDAFSVVPMQFTAFGVRQEHQAVKLLYYLLWFGAFEEGGTKNNCRATLRCPFEYTLGLRRYKPFRLDLETQTIPTGPTGTAQKETATAAGTASSSNNITVTITAAGLPGSPLPITVAIASGDTPSVWIKKVLTQLRLNAALNAFFLMRTNGANLILTKRAREANDATLNIAIAAGSTGITAAPTSANTTAGVADSSFEWFRCLGIKKIENGMAEVTGIAYNRTAYEAFETESVDPPEPGFCTLDADCPDGFVCRDGVCVPEGPGPICPVAAPSVNYNTVTGMIEVTVPPC